MSLRNALGGLAGLVVGALYGFLLTVVIFVARARAGIFVFSLDDITTLRWEIIPTLLGLVGGAVLGWRDARVLWRTALAGLVGAVPAGVIGWFVGGAVWLGSAGPWAGMVIAVGVGLVTGLGLALFRWLGAVDAA